MSRHIIKRIDFLGRNVPILLQNKNGPCPLLAIANVLLLRGHIEIPITFTEVSIDQVIQLIATRIFDANSNTNMNADLQKNIDDVISILPALQKGLDLNVKFRHTKDYEFTREIATFDILGINLVHGWICDSDDESLINVLGAKSYNELVEKIINYQSAEQEYLNSKKKKIINEQGYDDENNETSSSTNNSNNNNNIKEVEDNNNNTPTTIKKDEDDVKEKGNDNAKNINTMTKNPIIDAKIVDDLVVIEQQNGNNNNNTTVVDGQKIIDDDENIEEEEEEEDDGGKNQAIVEEEEEDQVTKITENNINNNKTYENKVNHKDQTTTTTTTTEITNDETTTTTQEEDLQLLEAIELSRKATLKKEFEQNNTTIMFNGNKVNLFKMSQDSTIIQNFFSKTASQLTMTGLFKLHEEVRNNELCVFFRNNHFSTLLKRDGKIFLLLTDLGFEQQQNFVWEVLDGIDGDTTLATSKFKKAPPVANREQIYDAAVDFASNFDFSNNNNSNTANNNYNGTNTQNNPNYNNTDNNPPSFTRQYSEEDDLALAMQLQQQEEERNRLATTATTTTTTTTNIHGNDNRRYVQQQQQQQQRQQQRNGGYNLADQQAELDRLKQEHLKRQQQQRRQQQQQRQQQGRGKGKGRRSGNSSNCCIQ